MDKLTAIKIKYDDGTYSDEIPISVLSENVELDNTHTLVDVLGSIDVDVTGTIQDQISQLFNEKISSSELNNLYQSLDILKIQTINIPANSPHSSLVDPITNLNIKANEDFYFEYNQSSVLKGIALSVFPDSPPKPKTGVQVSINGKLLHEKKLITAPIDIKSIGIYADASD